MLYRSEKYDALTASRKQLRPVVLHIADRLVDWPLRQYILVGRLHQRCRGGGLTRHPQIPSIGLQHERHAVVELSSELAGFSRDDGEGPFGL